MRIIISPAKKMKIDTDCFYQLSAPEFLLKAKEIKCTLKTMTEEDLKSLWKCNDAIAKQNIERLKELDLEQSLTPAILSYEGIQYKYMAPGVFEDGHFDYISEHLRILSGFYGILRPFDKVVPYRLELQAKLVINDCKNLYDFWGDSLANELCKETNFILNLASREYSKAVIPYLPKDVHVITCSFGEFKDGKIVEKGTMCKMARGEMVRFLAEHNIMNPLDIKLFNRLGFTFFKENSNPNHYIFIKESNCHQ